MDKMKAINRLDINGGGQHGVSINCGYQDFNMQVTGISVYDHGDIPHVQGEGEGEPEPQLNVTVNIRITDLPKEEEKDGEATADAG